MRKGNAIIKFSKEYYFLSNFKNCPVTYDGITYQNAEAAFQAQKAPIEDRHRFAEISRGDIAKRLGGPHGPYRMEKGTPEYREWNSKNLRIMEEIVRAKFDQNPKLAEKLLDTGDLRLIEGNNWDDNFYGISLEEEVWPRKGKKKTPLKVDENGKYILAYKEDESNNQLGKILMRIREELKEKREV